MTGIKRGKRNEKLEAHVEGKTRKRKTVETAKIAKTITRRIIVLRILLTSG
jgi:hypothetical protein